MSRIKLIMCVVMTFVLCIMTLGYAALQEKIDVEVQADIDSTYRVEITRVQEGTVVGDARSASAPQYNGLNASFYVGLTNTTDIITYNIEITNYSTVDIKLNELSITVDGSNYIKAQKNGIRNGDIMLAGSTKNITLKVKYNGEAQSSEQTGTVTLNFNFTRLKGGVGEVASNLPSNYQELEYLESTGTQYIDTGIFVDTYNSELIIDFLYISKNDYYGDVAFGSEKGTNWSINYNGGWFLIGKTNYVNVYDYTPTNKNVEYTFDIKLNNGSVTMKINDVEKEKSYTPGNIDVSLYLFADNINNTSVNQFSQMRLYSFEYISDNTNVDFIPALDNNGVPCMYDTVSGETFYNAGTGDFLYQLKE